MKPLKDIGRLYSRHPLDGGMIPYDERLPDAHKIIILSFDERRELSKGLLFSFMLKYPQCHPENAGKLVEEFLKDNEL